MPKKVNKRRSNVVRERRAAPAGKLDFEVTYKNYEKLASFMNDRAKIASRKRSGLTAKDQKKVTQEIKRARHLGLLPFSSRV